MNITSLPNMNTHIALGRINGLSVMGYGRTTIEALTNAFRNYHINKTFK